MKETDILLDIIMYQILICMDAYSRGMFSVIPRSI
jgi:hypothetical protein